MLLNSQSIPHVDSKTLERIYRIVTNNNKEVNYKPIRNHYNINSFG